VILVDPYLSAKDPYDAVARSSAGSDRATDAEVPQPPDRSEDVGVARVSR
jgi:hypothetical protein